RMKGGARAAVLGEGREERDRCWMGSVKTNIGHLEAAAGVAGLIKTALSLQHGEIPPHLHLSRLNPLIKLAGTAFAIATERQSWPGREPGQTARPLIAAVSSFGFGGTNAQVILEAAPNPAGREAAQAGLERPRHLLALSAASSGALRALSIRYAAFLSAAPETPIADLCFTAAARRAHHRERLAVTGTTAADLKARLESFAA